MPDPSRRHVRKLLLGALVTALGNFSSAVVFREDTMGPPMENLFIGGMSRFANTLEARATKLGFGRDRLSDAGDGWPLVWEQTGTAPVPPRPLFVRFPSQINIRPNDTVTSGLILQEPQLEWESSGESALHTVIMLDADASEGTFVHHLVSNVPGADVSSGDVVASYHPAFAFSTDGAGGLVEDASVTRRFLYLVYRQEDGSRVEMEPFGDPCGREGFQRRRRDLQSLLDEAGLTELWAGNFFRNRFSGRATRKYICEATKCFGTPWPEPLPGVNDESSCGGGGGGNAE